MYDFPMNKPDLFNIGETNRRTLAHIDEILLTRIEDRYDIALVIVPN